MRWLLRLFLLLPALAGCATPAEQSQPYGEGLLWRIDPPGGGATSYLFGTFHVTQELVGPLPAPVGSTLEAAHSLTLELLVDSAMQRKMGRLMLAPAGRELDRRIDPALYAAVLQAAQRYGWDADRVRRLEPWAASMAFSTPPSQSRARDRGALVLDRSLEQAVRSAGKPVYALESIDEQLSVFSGLPEPLQIQYLATIIAQNPRAEEQYAAMKQLYLARQPGQMLAATEASLERMPAELGRSIRQRLLVERNARMVARMAPRLTEGGAFIAVGALHLPGEQGVLRQLERQGFRLQRLY